MVFVLPNESIIDKSANSNGYTVSGEYDVSPFMSNVTAERILIPLSKTKIVLLLVGSVVFVAVSLWLWDHADEIPHRNPLYVEAVAIAGIGFFGLCGLYALFKLFDTAPGLIVDAEGIVDNSSGVSAGRIPWSHICGFKIKSVHKQRFLTIEVHNPETYVRKANFLKRPLVTLNMKYFGGPIQISANTLKIDFDRLIEVVTGAEAKHRQPNPPLQPPHLFNRGQGMPGV
jgi:hypothetical protein